MDPLSDLDHQVIYIVGSGAAGVHHKARVLFRHLGPAHAKAFQPRLVDEGGGKVALRPLEGAAGGGQVQGLLLPAALVQLPHFGGDLLPVSLFQAEHGGENDAAPQLLEQTAAVAEGALLPGQLIEPLLRQVVEHHALHRVLQLSAVGAGVHDQPAAYGAGDAGGKLQPLQAVLLGKAGQLCQRHPGLGIDGPVRQLEHPGQPLGADDEQVFQPLIREQDVGAVAQHIGGDMFFFQKIADF